MNWEYYSETYNGKLSKEQFEALLPFVLDIFQLVINDEVPYWRLDRIVMSDLDIDRAVCIQVDFLDTVGGKSALEGMSSLDLSAIETDGFSMNFGSKNASNGVTALDDLKYNGMPLSPLAKTQLITTLRKAGFLQRGLG